MHHHVKSMLGLFGMLQRIWSDEVARSQESSLRLLQIGQSSEGLSVDSFISIGPFSVVPPHLLQQLHSI